MFAIIYYRLFNIDNNVVCFKVYSMRKRFRRFAKKSNKSLPAMVSCKHVGDDKDHSPENRHVVIKPSDDGLYPSRHS